MKNTEINKDTQIKTVNFLVKAKTILLNNEDDLKKSFEHSYSNTLQDWVTHKLCVDDS